MVRPFDDATGGIGLGVHLPLPFHCWAASALCRQLLEDVEALKKIELWSAPHSHEPLSLAVAVRPFDDATGGIHVESGWGCIHLCHSTVGLHLLCVGGCWKM
jgi:hypothetical protein